MFNDYQQEPMHRSEDGMSVTAPSSNIPSFRSIVSPPCRYHCEWRLSDMFSYAPTPGRILKVPGVTNLQSKAIASLAIHAHGLALQRSRQTTGCLRCLITRFELVYRCVDNILWHAELNAFYSLMLLLLPLCVHLSYPVPRLAVSILKRYSAIRPPAHYHGT